MLNGSQILGEIVYFSTDGINFNEEYRMIYLYDEAGAPIGMKYRTPTYAQDRFDYYFFEKNLQGDIVAIYNESGTKIGAYTYDAWGNHTATSNISGYNFILYNNPFRYRGYYYDTETGYYYLQSRYYDPVWGRFINADSSDYLGASCDIFGYNIFAYCSNNPIMYTDSTGHFFISFSILIKSIVIAVSVAATVNDIYQIASGNITTEIKSSTEKGDPKDDVEIKDSYKILTPWVQYGYSFYLNHINKETKTIIDGTVIGTTYEWGLHNVAYFGCSILGWDEYADIAQSVNVGKTLFSDDHGGFIEHVMKISYMFLNPLAAIHDLIINGGYKE